MAIAPEEQEGMVEKIMELFQSNEASIDYGNDPQAWVDENLPDGAEASDVASCMPDVAQGMGGPYQANAARYNESHGAQAQAATSTVVNEVSYTYNTIYQQNAFIYAEEGAQVTNIQGDGNIVDQTQIDIDYNAEHPPEWDDYEDPEPDYVDADGNPISKEEYDEKYGEEGGEEEEYEDGEEGEEGEEGENGVEAEEGMEEPPMEPDPMEPDPMEPDPMEPDPMDPPMDPVPEAPAPDPMDGMDM